VVWDFLLGVLSLEKGVLSLGYLLGLVLLPELFYLSKVTMLGGGCVPMVGCQYCWATKSDLPVSVAK
jgi:hypothetical protein